MNSHVLVFIKTLTDVTIFKLKKTPKCCLELGLSVSSWLLVCLMVSPFHQLSYSKVYIKQTHLSTFGLRIDRDLKGLCHGSRVHFV